MSDVKTTPRSAILPPLPPQPDGVPWPTAKWPEGPLPRGADGKGLARLLDRTFAVPEPEEIAATKTVLVVQAGRIVAERYAAGIGPETTLPSWSMAKSVLHAVVGILAREGRLDIHAPAPVPEWQWPGDLRAGITTDELLRMSSGLQFVEDYVDDGVSDVIKMLFGEGQKDMAHFAAWKALIHPRDTQWSYSSGTSNIVSGIVARAVGGGKGGYGTFLENELFGVLGMHHAEPKFDEAGTWVGSSFLYDTARDFARLGLLYLRNGVWEGRRLLPPAWVDYARTPTPTAPAGQYGAHFWLARDGLGSFSANGYEGQYVLIVPPLDLVVVRLGQSPAEKKPALQRFLSDVVRCFLPLIGATDYPGVDYGE